jgi:hypothetical protein
MLDISDRSVNEEMQKAEVISYQRLVSSVRSTTFVVFVTVGRQRITDYLLPQYG